MIKPQRILALGAHTDDVELGCGALLNRFLREGSQVMTVAFSGAEASLPSGWPASTLRREFRASMRHLGLTEQDFYLGQIPVRRFPERRQEILDTLITLKQSYRPDLIITMNSHDTHQDHQVVHIESVRAFRGYCLLGYELPWNQQTSSTTVFIEISPDDMDVKMRMLSEYTSQKELKRKYMQPDYVRSAAVFRGCQGGFALAEAYEVITLFWPMP